MIDRIKDYFAFNKKEQRGMIILLGLMLLSISANVFLPGLLPQKEFDITPFQKEVAEFMASVDQQDSIRQVNSLKYPGVFKQADVPVLAKFLASPFYFDPNDLDEDKWTEIGMDPKVIRNILRYREKGGTFRDKEGFKKIYGMPDSVFAILSPYIQIAVPESKSQTSKYDSNNLNYNSYHKNSVKKFIHDTVMIELNSADSASLLALKDIGPSYAGRIIKYREKLGGYYRIDQLLEIRGLDSIRFQQFSHQVRTDSGLVRKIDINSVTFKELLRHPYFEYYLVKAIFSYKDEIKAFDSLEQLRKIPVMYEELYDKISPYLEVK